MVRLHPSNPRYEGDVALRPKAYYAAPMAPDLQLNITADPREKIRVGLVGQEYDILPPKAAFGLKLAVRAKQAADDPSSVSATVDEWIVKAFGKAEAKKIQARLEDAEDDLDFPHIVQLMEAVIAMVSGNPTSSS
jgi:hypothetical protein